MKSLGPTGPRDGRPAGGRRRSPVSLLLDAAIRTGRPLAVAAARDGLCGTERREHGGERHLGETYLDPPRIAGTAGMRSRRKISCSPHPGEISRLLVTAHGVGLVDFALIPHLDHRITPDNSLANAEKWAAGRYRRPCQRTRLTIRPPYKSLMAPSTSSPRGTGSCLPPKTLIRSNTGFAWEVVTGPPPSPPSPRPSGRWRYACWTHAPRLLPRAPAP